MPQLDVRSASWHRPLALLSLGTAFALVLTGCSTAASVDSANGADAATGTAPYELAAAGYPAGSLWDASVVHEVTIDADPDEVTAMIQNFLDTGDKDWLQATVTIDGTTYEEAGIKLKGNSSLRDTTIDTDVTSLPWRVRLDKYVDGQASSHPPTDSR